jgi:putative DNA methylase
MLAGCLPAATSERDFWQTFSSSTSLLSGKVVADPFMGGATSLVEASRLGATGYGCDIDPLAVAIAELELDPPPLEDVAEAGESLLESLRADLQPFYPSEGEMSPLHYFSLRKVRCPRCGHFDHVYKSLVLARAIERPGAVVRESGIDAFCPDCLSIHHLPPERSLLQCCGRRRRLDSGTFERARYRCPACDEPSSHFELKTAAAERTLLAVEESSLDGYREIRAANKQDLRAIEAAARELNRKADQLVLPRRTVASDDEGRPQMYGAITASDLFTPRQQLFFGRAFALLRERDLSSEVRRTLALGLSNALATNNAYCGYATDYGRLAPLFSVRGYSMPVLSVELNPLHSSGGRGTLRAVFRRLTRALATEVRRHTWDLSRARVVSNKFRSRPFGSFHLHNGNAQVHQLPANSVDIFLTDPPYFDFIPYSALSDFFRVWLEEAGEISVDPDLSASIFPVGDDGPTYFATCVGNAFANSVRSLRTGGLFICTFHSTNEWAWTALKSALKTAGLVVTAAFPIWADAKSVGHGKEGNCEWDVVFVCRTSAEGSPTTVHAADWIKALKRHHIGAADLRSWELAANLVNSRGGA